MTVAELIEKLKTMPQDAIVVIESSSGEYEPQFINAMVETWDDIWGEQTQGYPKPFIVIANNHNYAG